MPKKPSPGVNGFTTMEVCPTDYERLWEYCLSTGLTVPAAFHRAVDILVVAYEVGKKVGDKAASGKGE